MQSFLQTIQHMQSLLRALQHVQSLLQATASSCKPICVLCSASMSSVLRLRLLRNFCVLCKAFAFSASTSASIAFESAVLNNLQKPLHCSEQVLIDCIVYRSLVEHAEGFASFAEDAEANQTMQRRDRRRRRNTDDAEALRARNGQKGLLQVMQQGRGLLQVEEALCKRCRVFCKLYCRVASICKLCRVFCNICSVFCKRCSQAEPSANHSRAKSFASFPTKAGPSASSTMLLSRLLCYCMLCNASACSVVRSQRFSAVCVACICLCICLCVICIASHRLHCSCISSASTALPLHCLQFYCILLRPLQRPLRPLQIKPCDKETKSFI